MGGGGTYVVSVYIPMDSSGVSKIEESYQEERRIFLVSNRRGGLPFLGTTRVGRSTMLMGCLETINAS